MPDPDLRGGFVHQSHAARVVFGPGTLDRVPAEVVRLGLRRVAVLCLPEQAELGGQVADSLGAANAVLVDRARMHVPNDLVEEVAATADAAAVDGYVAVGGGSAIGLAKALALRSGRPILAAPTTYAGSEMTPIWGTTTDGVKQTGRDAKVLPRVVVYDPSLTLTLPPRLTATSGINAVAHAVEALYAPERSPVVALQATDGVRALATALPTLVKDPTDLAARSDALYGAWLCGMCLGATTMGLHHKLCHVLGGAFDLPHADTHTVVLPFVLDYNAPAVPAALDRLRQALGTEDPAAFLQELARRTGAPTSLRELGLSSGSIPHAAALAVANRYANPRPTTESDVGELLTRAWHGILRDPRDAA